MPRINGSPAKFRDRRRRYRGAGRASQDQHRACRANHHRPCRSVGRGRRLSLSTDGAFTPANLSIGQHTLWIAADNWGQVAESDETNNFASLTRLCENAGSRCWSATTEPKVSAKYPIRVRRAV
jgi:hypothetical protein